MRPIIFIRLQNQVDTFVVKNFMQDFPSSNLVHIYRYFSKAPENFSVEELLKRTAIYAHHPQLILSQLKYHGGGLHITTQQQLKKYVQQIIDDTKDHQSSSN